MKLSCRGAKLSQRKTCQVSLFVGLHAATDRMPVEWPFNHAIVRSHTMPPHTDQERASECVASERHTLTPAYDSRFKPLVAVVDRRIDPTVDSFVDRASPVWDSISTSEWGLKAKADCCYHSAGLCRNFNRSLPRSTRG